MKLHNLYLIALTLFLASCGSSGSGLDPHLSVDEIRELQQELEIDLVGKWKLRRPTGSISNKTFTATNNCDVTQIEFIENNTYLLSISYTAAGSSELRYQTFKGKFDLIFKESDTEVVIERLVLMGADYVSSGAVPLEGSVATISEIVIDASGEDISFSIQLGQGTAATCLTDSVISLTGDKEEKLEPNAPEDSNHFKIQQDWRLISFTVNTEENNEINGLCYLLAENFYDRCYNQETQEFDPNCPQSTTLTLLFSGYGTYLLVYYDGSGGMISSEEGEWRWMSDTEIPYSVIQVRFENDSWEDSDAVEIAQLNESSLLVQELNSEDGTSADDEIAVYNFQLASLPFADSSCGDLSEYSDTDNY